MRMNLTSFVFVKFILLFKIKRKRCILFSKSYLQRKQPTLMLTPFLFINKFNSIEVHILACFRLC